jgi:hypothetical protein
MNATSVIRKSLILATVTLCLNFAVLTFAQVQSQTSTTSGTPTKEVKVESGEVVAVQGNDLFVMMSDGTLRHFPNIPASAKVNVDGKELGIHELQPGMKLQRTTVTTTTPQMVTTVETVKGKIWQVSPPASVILTLENGENQSFKIPKGQKFTVDGKQTDAFVLKKGMVVTASKVVETPVTAVSQQRQVTGTMPAAAPVLIVMAAPTPAPAETTAIASAGAGPAAPEQLPKTATRLPLVGLLGLLLISASFGMALLRRSLGVRS